MTFFHCLLNPGITGRWCPHPLPLHTFFLVKTMAIKSWGDLCPWGLPQVSLWLNLLGVWISGRDQSLTQLERPSRIAGCKENCLRWERAEGSPDEQTENLKRGGSARGGKIGGTGNQQEWGQEAGQGIENPELRLFSDLCTLGNGKTGRECWLRFSGYIKGQNYSKLGYRSNWLLFCKLDWEFALEKQYVL